MANTRKADIGMVFDFMLPKDITASAVEEALRRHEQTHWQQTGERVSRSLDSEGRLLVVVSQPDGLASFVMTNAVYEQQYRVNPLRLSAEHLQHFREIPDLTDHRNAREESGPEQALSR